MSQRHLGLALIAFGVTLSNLEGTDPGPPSSGELAKLARTRLDAARRSFERHWHDKDWSEVEIPYQWSRRWLEAQCQVSDKDEDRIVAFRQHLDRMMELKRIAWKQFQATVRIGSVDDVNATEYYVAEAAEWLVRATAHDKSMAKR